ncbi:MAG: dTDP-4-dehydrorhamnose reductase [Rhodobiaceae bacterium]|nr:dTDP-4-dehydrorhamnose reductase [Rhodobiaceae bacterium]
MRVLVTGMRGQVVTALREAATPEIAILPLGRPDLDLDDPDRAGAAARKAEADIVVSAAAFTDVDRAESEPEAAHRANALAPEAIAAAAADKGIPVIHLSTDYVFSGDKGAPYLETDAAEPANVYGRTKLDGEARVAAANRDHVILRTAWVHAPSGRNFVRTMLSAAEMKTSVTVVADQIGNPTYAPDIADGILTVAARLLAAPGDPSLRGIFHMAAAGEASRADLAEYVFAVSAARGGAVAEVTRVTSAAFATPARRPLDTRLDCGRIAATYGIRLPDWRDGIDRCLTRLLPDRRAAGRGGQK